MDSVVEGLELEELIKKVSEGGEDGVKAFNTVIGAFGTDFLSTLVGLYYASKGELLNQMSLTFDGSEGDVYEVIVVRNRQSRLEQLGLSGDSMDLSSLFKGQSLGSPIASSEGSAGV